MLIALVLMAVGAASADAAARFTNDLYRDRHVVERAAMAEFGPRYACAVAAPRRGNRPRVVLLYVVGRDTVRSARALRPKLKRPKRLKVRVTSKEHSHRAMKRVLAAVEAFQPHTVEATAMALQSPLKRRKCPQVEITLLPRGEASEDQEHWAARMVRRYGRDRVVVRRADLTRRGGSLR